MNNALVISKYSGHQLSYNEHGWLNATKAAACFNKRPVDWLNLDSTKEYISMLAEISNCEKISLLKTKRGRHNSGTWFHPDLAVAFARWLDTRFSIWCDKQIKAILSGSHPHYDWKRIRHQATTSHKIMDEALRVTREGQGKVSQKHHYINEARMINWALTGEFSVLDRDRVPEADLSLLATLEVRNTFMIVQGLPYKKRKSVLKTVAVDHRINHQAISLVQEGVCSK